MSREKLTIVRGPTGTGKSTLATALVHALTNAVEPVRAKLCELDGAPGEGMWGERGVSVIITNAVTANGIEQVVVDNNGPTTPILLGALVEHNVPFRVVDISSHSPASGVTVEPPFDPVAALDQRAEVSGARAAFIEQCANALASYIGTQGHGDAMWYSDHGMFTWIEEDVSFDGVMLCSDGMILCWPCEGTPFNVTIREIMTSATEVMTRRVTSATEVMTRLVHQRKESDQ